MTKVYLFAQIEQKVYDRGVALHYYLAQLSQQ